MFEERGLSSVGLTERLVANDAVRRDVFGGGHRTIVKAGPPPDCRSRAVKGNVR